MDVTLQSGQLVLEVPTSTETTTTRLNQTIESRTPQVPQGLSNSLLASIAESNGTVVQDMVSNAALDNAVNQANETLQHIGRRIEHSVHEDSRTIIVRVVNSHTGEVIRELPDESRLDALVYLKEALGINVNESV